MTRWLLSSAVCTSDGAYTYRTIDQAEARAWLGKDKVLSRVGYGNAAAYIRRILGVNIQTNRDPTLMRTGDEALVVRLRYRVQDPRDKKEWQPDDSDYELGLLTKIGDATVLPLLR